MIVKMKEKKTNDPLLTPAGENGVTIRLHPDIGTAGQGRKK